MFIDTHIHLNMEQYDKDRDDVVARASRAGVKKIIDVSTDIESGIKSRELAAAYDEIFSAVGIHPHEASTWSEETEVSLRQLLTGPKIVALGEIGLDYYYDYSPREAQHYAFRQQLRLAQDLHLPVIIHVREAMSDALRILEEEADGIRGVFHCFGGDAADAREVVARGFHVSFTGVVTFKNFKRTDAVAAVPLENLLLETDGPFMAPVPYRGKRNESAFMVKTAEKIAEIKDTTLDFISGAILENSRFLFTLGE